MAFNRIILWLGYSFLYAATLMALSALAGLAFGELDQAALFGGITIGISLLGAVFVFSTRLMPGKESFTEALTFLISFWLVMPLVIMLPFMLGNIAETPVQAYFEGVSALTTTGASSLDPDQLPKTLHIWRSLVQWSGGVIVATFAVVILAALNLKGTGVHRSLLFTFKKGELWQQLLSVSQVIILIYGLISFVCFAILVASGTSVFEAICLALTSVSTGGLTPSGEPLAFYVKGVGLFALCLSCFLGAVNVAVLWDILRNRTLFDLRKLISNVEHRSLLVLVGIIFVIGCFYTDFEHFLTVLPEAIFFASSTGYDYHVIGVELVPPVILISIALIGGSALSTTGGLKLIRMLLLFRHLDTDMDRLTHPSRVVPVLFRGQRLADSAFLSIWMYFVGYTLVFATGILLLAGAGLEFSVAVASSAASVSNMGPLLAATMPVSGFEDFTAAQMLIASILMLIGRIEVLAALAFFSPRLWRS